MTMTPTVSPAIKSALKPSFDVRGSQPRMGRAWRAAFSHFWGQVVCSSSSFEEHGPCKKVVAWPQAACRPDTVSWSGSFRNPKPTAWPRDSSTVFVGSSTTYNDSSSPVPEGDGRGASLPSSAPWLARAVSATYCMVLFAGFRCGFQMSVAGECLLLCCVCPQRSSAQLGASLVDECRRSRELCTLPTSDV